MKLYEAAAKAKGVSPSSKLTQMTKRVFASKTAPLGATVKVRTTKEVLPQYRGIRARRQTSNADIRFTQEVALVFNKKTITKTEKAACSRFLNNHMNAAMKKIQAKHGTRIETIANVAGAWEIEGKADRHDWMGSRKYKQTRVTRYIRMDYIEPKDETDAFPAAASLILSLAKSFKMTPREVIEELKKLSETPGAVPPKKVTRKKRAVRRRTAAQARAAVAAAGG